VGCVCAEAVVVVVAVAVACESAQRGGHAATVASAKGIWAAPLCTCVLPQYIYIYF
jgi:hypothetical protein